MVLLAAKRPVAKELRVRFRMLELMVGDRCSVAMELVAFLWNVCCDDL